MFNSLTAQDSTTFHGLYFIIKTLVYRTFKLINDKVFDFALKYSLYFHTYVIERRKIEDIPSLIGEALITDNVLHPGN